jgi:hypothetical protein
MAVSRDEVRKRVLSMTDEEKQQRLQELLDKQDMLAQRSDDREAAPLPAEEMAEVEILRELL